MGDVGFKSFEMKNKFNLGRSDFCRFLQIRNCILSNIKHIQLGLTIFREISLKKEEKSKGASKFYERIRNTQVPKLGGLKLCW